MPRRRLTLVAYARRRWRTVGAVAVLLLGSLLVLAVTDRGHDPAWSASLAEVDQAFLAPDASAAYALLREGGNVSGLEARDGLTGELLWSSRIQAPRALLAASENGVAVATDFPFAFLTMYNPDGSPRWAVALEGNPVAMAMDGERLALALDAPGNPVLFYDGDLLIRTYHLASPVRALDVEAGLVATGGPQGDVVVHRDRQEVVNVTLPMAIRSLRIAQDGTAVVVGGASLVQDSPRGEIAFLDVGTERALRWMQDTPVGVGLVDVDAAALRAMAVEEAPPEATIHVYEGSTGATRWTRLLPGSIARQDSGTLGGAAMSPDGASVAVATLRGDILVLDTDDGRERWTYRAGGAGVITFAQSEESRLLVAARLLENRPYDTLLLFSTDGEPVGQRAPLLAGVVLATAAGALALLVGYGYWRARRPY